MPSWLWNPCPTRCRSLMTWYFSQWKKWSLQVSEKKNRFLRVKRWSASLLSQHHHKPIKRRDFSDGCFLFLIWLQMAMSGIFEMSDVSGCVQQMGIQATDINLERGKNQTKYIPSHDGIVGSTKGLTPKGIRLGHKSTSGGSFFIVWIFFLKTIDCKVEIDEFEAAPK